MPGCRKNEKLRFKRTEGNCKVFTSIGTRDKNGRRASTRHFDSIFSTKLRR